jgi:hypothetical protein
MGVASWQVPNGVAGHPIQGTPEGVRVDWPTLRKRSRVAVRVDAVYVYGWCVVEESHVVCCHVQVCMRCELMVGCHMVQEVRPLLRHCHNRTLSPLSHMHPDASTATQSLGRPSISHPVPLHHDRRLQALRESSRWALGGAHGPSLLIIDRPARWQALQAQVLQRTAAARIEDLVGLRSAWWVCRPVHPCAYGSSAHLCM